MYDLSHGMVGGLTARMLEATIYLEEGFLVWIILEYSTDQSLCRLEVCDVASFISDSFVCCQFVRSSLFLFTNDYLSSNRMATRI